MHIVKREAAVSYSAEDMFTLVNDVEAYPEFLPWCVEAHIEEILDDGMIAGLTLEKGGLRKRFTTRNETVPGKKLEMHLIDGPFKHLYGVWTFDKAESGCKICVSLEFDFSSRVIAMLIGPLFQHAADTLLDCFIQRANTLYDES